MAGGQGTEERRFAKTLTAAVLRKPAPPPSSAFSKTARRRARVNTLSERLFEAFPELFKYPPVPLAIGIGHRLCELLSPEFKPAEIRFFLHAWTSGPRYLKAVSRGEMRRNLDGSPAGLPEPEHRAAAKERLDVIGHLGDRSHAPKQRVNPTL
jgi:sRNA-binding protein